MKYEAIVDDPLHAVLAEILIAKLGLDPGLIDDLSPLEPLVGGRLGLDPLDVLEFADEVQEQFGVAFDDSKTSKNAVANVATLATYIRSHASAQVAGQLPMIKVTQIAGFSRKEPRRFELPALAAAQRW